MKELFSNGKERTSKGGRRKSGKAVVTRKVFYSLIVEYWKEDENDCLSEDDDHDDNDDGIGETGDEGQEDYEKEFGEMSEYSRQKLEQLEQKLNNVPVILRRVLHQGAKEKSRFWKYRQFVEYNFGELSAAEGTVQNLSWTVETERNVGNFGKEGTQLQRTKTILSPRDGVEGVSLVK